MAAAQPPEANATSAKQLVPFETTSLHLDCALLYERKDEGATTLVTETIRSALPAAVQEYYSPKSFRQGGINQATKHKDMNYLFLSVSVLTGHAGDNNSSQYYIDPTDVGRTVPAMYLCMRERISRLLLPFQLLTHSGCRC